MWCPSATLSVWANAWLAGLAAPDDVLDALRCWTAKQSVTAYDAVAAGNTGLSWPGAHDGGPMSLLQAVRAAAGAQTAPSIGVVLPVPGDVRGLPAGTQFERDALNTGEAVLVCNPDDPETGVGVLPQWEDDATGQAALSWTVYALPGVPATDRPDLREAEYSLRTAVRSAAEALTAIGLATDGSGTADPRALIRELLQSSQHHRSPDHTPTRALRVLDSAAHVDAIITVGAGLLPSGTQSSSAARLASEALSPLDAVVRSARVAALGAIVGSAWPA